MSIPNDTCPTDSAIVPSFLSDSSVTSFSYPIYQQVACQGAKLDLVCQSNTLIHIYAAYFGIQSTTNTECVTSNASEAPAQCYSPLSYSQIVSLCEYQNSCLLYASASGLYVVDMCPSYSSQQQLFVQYQCVDSSLFNYTVATCTAVTDVPTICPALDSSSSTNQGTWCDNALGEGSILSINCPAGKTITIVCAFYGLHPSISTCNTQFSTSPVCYFQSSFTQVGSSCNGQNSCTISSFSTFFSSDPCNGLDKTLYVQWKCT